MSWKVYTFWHFPFHQGVSCWFCNPWSLFIFLMTVQSCISCKILSWTNKWLRHALVSIFFTFNEGHRHIMLTYCVEPCMAEVEGRRIFKDWLYPLGNKTFTWKKNLAWQGQQSLADKDWELRTLSDVRVQGRESSLGWDSQGRLPGRGGVGTGPWK